jgi:SAM-dependent methyltransferase
MASSGAQPGEAPRIAAANAEQAAAWDGEEGDRWTEHEERYDAAGSRYNRPLLEAARIGLHHRVLDVGCGCGGSTRAAARVAVAGTVLGVDLSARMIARARERSRAEGLTNTRFERADAQVYPFPDRSFDRAISRFGAMFFGDPVAAFRNIGRALRPGGRLALLSWQALDKNEWVSALRQALAAGRALPEPPAGAPGLFGLAEPDTVRRVLAEGGFAEIALDEARQPMVIGSDAADAFEFVRTLGMTKGMLEELDEPARARALDALRATLTAHETPEGVLFDSRAWLITAHRP